MERGRDNVYVRENLTPGLKPSIEHALHISVYNSKNGINAIVHAHPVFASSFTAMKAEINTSLTAEARAICGEPKLVPYALMEPMSWQVLLPNTPGNQMFCFLRITE